MTVGVVNTKVDAGLSRYRVVFDDRDAMTLVDAAQHLEGLQRLVFLCALSNLRPSVAEYLNAQAIPDLYREFRTLDRDFRSSVLSPRVERISYNSPYDVIFAIPPGLGILYLAASRALSLYERWQDVRVKRAHADMAEAEATRFVRDTLALPDDAGNPNPTVSMPRDLQRTVDEDLKKSARMLRRVVTFERIPEDLA